MVQQDQKVVGVHAAVLGGAGEEVVRVLHDELVHGVALGNQDGKAVPGPAPGPARLLPGAGDGARVARHDARLQVADVDAQLQRVGAHNAHDRAVAQPLFNVAPEVRQIAAPVAGDEVVVARDLCPEGILEILGEHLHVEPAGGEHDGLDLVVDEVACDLARRGERRLADAQLAVHDGRVIEDEGLLGLRRPALIDERHLALQQVLGVLLGVCHRGRAADEHRVGPVEPADPLQPAEHVGQMAAEHPAVDVQLVHHHVLQIGKELLPLGVVRQDAGMQHVGVGDHHMALLADGLARVIGRIAVIGEGLDVGLQFADETVHLVHLVIGQGLGGEEVNGPRLRLLQYFLEHRDVVAQRLAACRGRHQDHVGACAHKVDCLRLVGVELLHAAPDQHGLQQGTHPVRVRRKTARRGRDVRDGGCILPEAPVALGPGQPFCKTQARHCPA